MRNIKTFFLVFLICFITITVLGCDALFGDMFSSQSGIGYAYFFYIPKDSGYIVELIGETEIHTMSKISASPKTKYDTIPEDDFDIYWIAHNKKLTSTNNFANSISIKVIYADGFEEELKANIQLPKVKYGGKAEEIEQILESKKLAEGIKCIFKYFSA